MRHVGQSWRSPGRVRPSVVRRVWLWSGLVLFTYVATHLANHALGLVSLEAMETGRAWFLLVWRHPVGTVALYGALSAHIVLALWSLYRRRHFRLPAWEALQLLLLRTLLGSSQAGSPMGFVGGERRVHAGSIIGRPRSSVGPHAAALYDRTKEIVPRCPGRLVRPG